MKIDQLNSFSHVVTQVKTAYRPSNIFFSTAKTPHCNLNVDLALCSTGFLNEPLLRKLKGGENRLDCFNSCDGACTMYINSVLGP